jgi:hypothetical protein
MRVRKMMMMAEIQLFFNHLNGTISTAVKTTPAASECFTISSRDMKSVQEGNPQ